MLLMLAKQELIGHSSDVIANDDVAGFRLDQIFVRRGHGPRGLEIVRKKFFEAAHGAVAVFADGGVIVDMPKEEVFHFGVSLRERIAKTGEPARGAADVVDRGGPGREHAKLGVFDQISGQLIERVF